ncbi:hypothetical protein KLPN52230_26255 [Klebsiella pneumoniae]
MMSLWDALRMNMMISYQELVRTFLKPFTQVIEGTIYLFLDRFSDVPETVTHKDQTTGFDHTGYCQAFIDFVPYNSNHY